jgi:predicted transcriptional regulator
MKLFEKITNPREIRRKLGLNQQEFWSRIGVTQSGGSRYESGRNMPKPVRELLRWFMSSRSNCPRYVAKTLKSSI